MSLTVRPSLQGRFSLVFSGDPALQPRPEDLPKSASKGAVRDRVNQQAKWEHDLRVSNETSNWTCLLIQGAEPTVFSFELPKGEARRALVDQASALLADGRGNVLASRLFRAALRDVTGWPESAPKLTFIREDGLQLVSDEVVTFLDEEVTPRVIGELGGAVYERLVKIPGK